MSITSFHNLEIIHFRINPFICIYYFVHKTQTDPIACYDNRYVKPDGYQPKHQPMTFVPKQDVVIFWGFWKSMSSIQFQNDIMFFYNYANPVYGVATICHLVRCLRWGHPSLFHTATPILIWYKMICAWKIYHTDLYGSNIYKHASRVCAIWDSQAF